MKSFNEIFWQLHANVPHSTHLEYIASFLFKNTITDIKKYSLLLKPLLFIIIVAILRLSSQLQ